MAATALVDRRNLPPGLAVDAADNRPFSKQFRLALVRTRFPVFSTVILVGIVLERSGQGILEVPEISRRDRVPTRSNLGLPALFAHGDAAADDFVDVSHGEGHVIDAGFAGTIEHEQVM